MSETGSASSSSGGNKPPRKVLVAMDGSKYAIYAFEFYAKNVHKPTDEVFMAHCTEHGSKSTSSALLSGNPVAIEEMLQEHDEHVKEVFTNIDQLANSYNIKHKLERLHGSPGDAIVKAAHQQKVDLVIVGSRGHGTVRRTIMGSVSDYIVHHSHIPVLVCKKH